MKDTALLQLSLPAKEAIKTGLAMAVACGVAMGMGWTNPYWACIAVAVVSMPTYGESLNKCLHRLLGTLLGGVTALVLAGLFPQDRWAIIGSVALLLGVAAYRITVSRYAYFWFIYSYVAMLVVLNVTGGSQHVFYTATIRMQENVLGIIVYALVSVFIWPQHCAADLDRLAVSLLGVQAKILDQYSALMLRQGAAPVSENWYSMESQLLAQWTRRLDAAETEQFEIHEARGWWWQMIGQCQELMDTMEQWRESLAELRRVDSLALLPGLPAFHAALARRVGQVRRTMEHGPEGAIVPGVDLALDAEGLRALPHRQQAALRTSVHLLERIEQLTLGLADSAQALRLPRRERAVPPPRSAPGVIRRPDADSLAALLRVMAGVWLAALAWIYFDMPGHSMFIIFVGVHSLIGLMTPQMNWTRFFLVNALGVVLAGLLYVFVMPRISGYLELSALLFGLTAVVYYLFWDPRATMLKMAGIMPLLLLANLQPRQSYDVALFANNATGMLLSIIVAGAMSAVPFSLRPEKMFLRVTTRYFRQAGHLLASLRRAADRRQSERSPAPLLAAMQVSVGKIGGWAAGIDYARLPANPPEKAAALVASLNAVTYRFKMLADAASQPQPLGEHCGAQAREWAVAIDEMLSPWMRGHLQTGALDACHQRLAAMEASLEQTLQSMPEGFEEGAYASAYRLLGSYRGLYRALLAHAALAAVFDWNDWREPRF